MVEKSQDKEMDKSVAVGNVENNSEKVDLGISTLNIYLFVTFCKYLASQF